MATTPRGAALVLSLLAACAAAGEETPCGQQAQDAPAGVCLLQTSPGLPHKAHHKHSLLDHHEAISERSHRGGRDLKHAIKKASIGKVCQIEEVREDDWHKVKVTVNVGATCGPQKCSAFKLAGDPKWAYKGLISSFMKATAFPHRPGSPFGTCSCHKFRPDDPNSEVELISFGYRPNAPCNVAMCFGQYAKVVYSGHLMNAKFSVADYNTFSMNHWKVGCVHGEASIEDLTTVGEMVTQALPDKAERLREAAGILDIKIPHVPEPAPDEPPLEPPLPEEDGKEEEEVDYITLVKPEFRNLALKPDATISMINSDAKSIKYLLPGDKIVDIEDTEPGGKGPGRRAGWRTRRVYTPEWQEKIARYIKYLTMKDLPDVTLSVIRQPVVKQYIPPATTSHSLRKVLDDAMGELENIEVIITMIYAKILELQPKLLGDGHPRIVEMVKHAQAVAQKAKEAREGPAGYLDEETEKVIQEFGPLELLRASDIVSRLGRYHVKEAVKEVMLKPGASIQADVTWLVNVLAALPATIERLQDETFTKAFGEVNTVFGAEITRGGGGEPEKDQLVDGVIKPILEKLKEAYDTHDAARVGSKDFSFDGSSDKVLDEHIKELQGVKNMVAETRTNFGHLLELLKA